MLFNSYEYLCCFLPLAVSGYFALGRSPAFAVVWLFGASLFFYAWWDVRNLPVILVSIGVNFVLGQLLQRNADRRVLIAGIVANLVALAIYKYADFVLANLNAIAGLSLPLMHLALPLGISFFTFTQIAYLVDCYRRRATEPKLAQYGLFVTFFPHLISGPILHHSEMMPQFASPLNKTARANNMAIGLCLLTIGLVKKVLIADNLAPIADAGFSRAASLSTMQAWQSALAYALQIYFDFSGYTDMALGAARMFNIRMPINFDSPYRSLSAREFWRRWHITLSRFLRDYLYVPLGGNRHGPGRRAVSLFVTFVLGGLWHGPAWTFVIWGALHGVGVAITRAWQACGLRLPRAIAWLLTFAFLLVTWIFFRAASVGDALSIVGAMVGLNTGAPAATAHGPSNVLDLVFLTLSLVVALTPWNSNMMAETVQPATWSAITVGVALAVCVLQLGKVTPFLYFNF